MKTLDIDNKSTKLQIVNFIKFDLIIFIFSGIQLVKKDLKT